MKTDEDLERTKEEVILCIANIYKRNIDSVDELVYEDVELYYDNEEEYFLPKKDYKYVALLADAIYCGNSEEIEKAQEEAEKHLLFDKIPETDGQLYIDKNSIRVIEEKKRKNR